MKVLFLLSRFPYPLEKGDKLRAFHQIKGLSKNHDITLVSLSDHKIKKEHLDILKPYCTDIHIIPLKKTTVFSNLLKALFLRIPYQVGYFYNPAIKRQIHSIYKASQPDVIYCQLIRMAEYCKETEDIPKVLDYMDAFSKGYKRRAHYATWLKPFLKAEYKRLIKYEHKVFEHFDEKVIISEEDLSHIPHSRNDHIKVIPNGVDREYFKPDNTDPKKFDLLFTGNMSYPPNVQSAVYLATEIFPLLLKHKPELKLMIAGANPAAQILALQSDHIKVTGWIPDIRDAYRNAKIFVAPMQTGTGLQNKLLEAMSMGLPSVTSTLANKGLRATNGEHLLIADKSEDYVKKILELIDNPLLGKQLATKADRLLAENYEWASVNAKLEQLLRSVVV